MIAFRLPFRSTRVGISLVLLISFATSLFAGSIAAARPASAVTAPQSAQTKVFLPTVANQTAAGAPEPRPADRDLVAAALAAGRIDYGTSLLYRAYALFGDDRLPREYWGEGPAEDHALFAEIALAGTSLPAAIKTQLQPFLARPAEAASVYTAQSAGQTIKAQDTVCDANGWTSTVSASAYVKLWARCTGDAAGDIQRAQAIVEPLYADMIALMGQPKKDRGERADGGSDHIDLYLVTPLESVRRGGVDRNLDARAIAVAADYFDNSTTAHTASGFMLLNRNSLGEVGFRADFAHEFFHVLQNNYNYAIGADGKAFWFEEASAEWSAAYFTRTIPAEVEKIHERFGNNYQLSDHSLHATTPSWHQYAAYIWPLFAEQETKSAQFMVATWNALRPVKRGDVADATAKIDAVFPFAQHFQDFAVRAINDTFNGDNPLGTRFVNLDASFPDGIRPSTIGKLKQERTIAVQAQGAAPQQFPVDLPALDAHYYSFTIGADVRRVTFDIGKIVPLASHHVSALVKIRNQPWELRKNFPQHVMFCKDKPEEDIEAIYFVVGNHTTDLTKKVTGSIDVLAEPTGCGCNPELLAQVRAVTQWQGTFTFDYAIQASGGDHSSITMHHAATLNVVMGTTNGGESFIGSPTGVASINDSAIYLDGDLDYAVVGNGQPKPYDFATNNWSRTTMNLWNEDCEYNWHTSIILPSSCSFWNTPASPCEPDAGSLGSGQLPLTGLVLAGSAQYPVRTFENIFANDGQFYEITNDDLIDLLGEGNFGTASVTWHFEPVTP